MNSKRSLHFLLQRQINILSLRTIGCNDFRKIPTRFPLDQIVSSASRASKNAKFCSSGLSMWQQTAEDTWSQNLLMNLLLWWRKLLNIQGAENVSAPVERLALIQFFNNYYFFSTPDWPQTCRLLHLLVASQRSDLASPPSERTRYLYATTAFHLSATSKEVSWPYIFKTNHEC